MKHTRMTLVALMAGMLNASFACAEDYPASNFQPKVIFSSEAAPASQAAASASPCEPKAVQAAEEVDARYPAASFQPKVIYSSDAAR